MIKSIHDGRLVTLRYTAHWTTKASLHTHWPAHHAWLARVATSWHAHLATHHSLLRVLEVLEHTVLLSRN